MKTNGEPTKTGDGYIDHADACRAQHDAWKHDPADPANELRDWMQDCMSPHAVAAIAACLQTNRTNNGEVDRQVNWFAEQLRKLVGGNEQASRLAEELGL